MLPPQSELSVFHWRDVFHHHGGNHPCELFPITLGFRCLVRGQIARWGMWGNSVGSGCVGAYLTNILSPSPITSISPALRHCVLWVPSSPLYLASGPTVQGAQLMCQRPAAAEVTLSLQQTLVL